MFLANRTAALADSLFFLNRTNRPNPLKEKHDMKLHKSLLALTVAALTFGTVTATRAESAVRPASTTPTTSVAAPKANSGVVNINEATADQLERLPGIGPSRAQAIVNFRKTHPFKRIEDLQRIKGLGKKSWNRLRPLIALSGPTTLAAAEH